HGAVVSDLSRSRRWALRGGCGACQALPGPPTSVARVAVVQSINDAGVIAAQRSANGVLTAFFPYANSGTTGAMPSSEPARPASQVTLKTVFTVSFGVLAVAALVFFLLRTQLAVTLSLAAAMVAVAMNHAVEVLTRR